MSLRPYQAKCIESILEAKARGVKRQLISNAGGTGKSVVFGHLPQHTDKRTLLAVHTRELVNQAAAHLQRWNPGLSVATEMAGQVTDGEQIVVASVQTIGRNLSTRLNKFDPKDFGWLIVDECHRSLSDTYTNVFDHFGVFDSSQATAVLTGFTATPRRGDGLALGIVYEEIVFSYGIQEAIKDGWLSDVRGIRVKTSTDISKVGSKDGDFKQDELAAAVNNPVRNRQIVEAWIKEAYPRRTIGFTVTVQHAKDLAFEFQKAGVPAEAVWGDDPNRDSKIKNHRAGKLSVLLCSQLLVEGYDDSDVACVLMARPTKSSVYFEQATVRGTRLGTGITNLMRDRAEGRLPLGAKVDMLLLDIADTTNKHSLFNLPTLFGLSTVLDLQGTSVMAALKAIEEAQAKNPDVDFSKLQDITKLKSYVEEANLFRPTFCSEITEASEMQWHRNGDDSYRLLLPGREKIVISGSLLGTYSVSGVLKGKRIDTDGYPDLSSALGATESLIAREAKEVLTLLRREASWHKGNISEAQLVLLRKFKVPEHFIARMTKGDAAQYITKKFGSTR